MNRPRLILSALVLPILAVFTVAVPPVSASTKPVCVKTSNASVSFRTQGKSASMWTAAGACIEAAPSGRGRVLYIEGFGDNGGPALPTGLSFAEAVVTIRHQSTGRVSTYRWRNSSMLPAMQGLYYDGLGNGAAANMYTLSTLAKGRYTLTVTYRYDFSVDRAAARNLTRLTAFTI